MPEGKERILQRAGKTMTKDKFCLLHKFVWNINCICCIKHLSHNSLLTIPSYILKHDYLRIFCNFPLLLQILLMSKCHHCISRFSVQDEVQFKTIWKQEHQICKSQTCLVSFLTEYCQQALAIFILRSNAKTSQVERS